MKCPNCGFNNPESSSFCMECGTKLNKNVASAPKVADVLPPSSIPQNKQDVSSPNFKVCALCGTENEPSNKFCKMCGEPLKSGTSDNFEVCPKCSFKIPAGNQFCPSCGLNLKEQVQRINLPSNPSFESVNSLASPLPNNPPPPPQSSLSNQALSSISPNTPVPSSIDKKQIPNSPQIDNQKKNKQKQKILSNQFIKQLPNSDTPPDLSTRTIEILKGERMGENFSFTRYISMGRNSSEITFNSDDYLEAKHFIIENTPDSIFVTDLETINGTFYNVLSVVKLKNQDCFYVKDSLFCFEHFPSDEWSLNPVYDRGVKLQGSLVTEKPIGRLRYFSPRGICSGVYLFWKENFVFYDNFMTGQKSEGKALFSLKFNKSDQTIFLEPYINDIYLKIRNKTEIQLPVKLRFGIEIIKIFDGK